MNSPNPALVTQRGARELPRLPLLLLCAVYVLPGTIGRDPWRNADLVAFAQMLGMAEGRISWLAPTAGGVPLADPSWLPYWLGAGFIALLTPFVDAAFAARVPFGLLLAGTLTLTWYASFHLARTANAQPLPLAFGGEAEPVDYARAIADGAVLAVIATLGLLRLGHETTPELAQLFGVSLFVYALAAAPFRGWQPRLAVLVSFLVLAMSGAPAVAVGLGITGAIVCWRSTFAEVRRYAAWVVAATALAAAIVTLTAAWRWRVQALDGAGLLLIARQWVWFLWPAWPFVLWTLWRWRGHLLHRHISVPLALLGVALAANLSMGGSDRALMLATPAAAMLAAFALPTFKRSTTAAIDWFSIFFFSVCALTIWVIYVAMHTGVPAKPAANVAKLAPGFVAGFSWIALLLAAAGTLAWIWLVRWRTGRQREALWKSLVLPAGGVALGWLLLMTLWLPLLDYALSMRTWVDRVTPHLQRANCVWAPGASAVTVAALEQSGRFRVDARADGGAGAACDRQLRVWRSGGPLPPDSGWQAIAEVRRPTDREEITVIYARVGAPR